MAPREQHSSWGAQRDSRRLPGTPACPPSAGTLLLTLRGSLLTWIPLCEVSTSRTRAGSTHQAAWGKAAQQERGEGDTGPEPLPRQGQAAFTRVVLPSAPGSRRWVRTALGNLSEVSQTFLGAPSPLPLPVIRTLRAPAAAPAALQPDTPSRQPQVPRVSLCHPAPVNPPAAPRSPGSRRPAGTRLPVTRQLRLRSGTAGTAPGPGCGSRSPAGCGSRAGLRGRMAEEPVPA